MADEKNSNSEEEKNGFFKNKTVRNVAIGVGVGAAVGVAAPVVVLGGLAATGFGAGGVLAGSVAAGIQSSSVAAGSLFATCQSVGAAGLAAGTQAGIFGAATSIGGLKVS